MAVEVGGQSTYVDRRRGVEERDRYSFTSLAEVTLQRQRKPAFPGCGEGWYRHRSTKGRPTISPKCRRSCGTRFPDQQPTYRSPQWSGRRRPRRSADRGNNDGGRLGCDRDGDGDGGGHSLSRSVAMAVNVCAPVFEIRQRELVQRSGVGAFRHATFLTARTKWVPAEPLVRSVAAWDVHQDGAVNAAGGGQK
jgi:hypothetical protein